MTSCNKQELGERRKGREVVRVAIKIWGEIEKGIIHGRFHACSNFGQKMSNYNAFAILKYTSVPMQTSEFNFVEEKLM